MGAQLGTGSFRHRKELVEFRGSAALKSLGKIRHAGYRSAANLIFEPKILRKVSFVSNFVDVRRKLACLLPGNEILKTRNFLRHDSLLLG